MGCCLSSEKNEVKSRTDETQLKTGEKPLSKAKQPSNKTNSSPPSNNLCALTATMSSTTSDIAKEHNRPGQRGTNIEPSSHPHANNYLTRPQNYRETDEFRAISPHISGDKNNPSKPINQKNVNTKTAEGREGGAKVNEGGIAGAQPYSLLHVHGVSGPPQNYSCREGETADHVDFQPKSIDTRTTLQNITATDDTSINISRGGTGGGGTIATAAPAAAPTQLTASNIFQSFTRLLFTTSSAKASDTVPKMGNSTSLNQNHSLSHSMNINHNQNNSKEGSSGAGQSRGGMGVFSNPGAGVIESECHPHVFMGAKGKDGETEGTYPPLKNQPNTSKSNPKSVGISRIANDPQPIRNSSNAVTMGNLELSPPPHQVPTKITREALMALATTTATTTKDPNQQGMGAVASPPADGGEVVIDEGLLSPEGLVRLQEEQHRVADFFLQLKAVQQQQHSPAYAEQVQNAIVAMNAAGSPLALNPILKDNRFTRADPTHKMSIEEIYIAAVEASNRKILDASVARVMKWSVEDVPPQATPPDYQSEESGEIEETVFSKPQELNNEQEKGKVALRDLPITTGLPMYSLANHHQFSMLHPQPTISQLTSSNGNSAHHHQTPYQLHHDPNQLSALNQQQWVSMNPSLPPQALHVVAHRHHFVEGGGVVGTANLSPYEGNGDAFSSPQQPSANLIQQQLVLQPSNASAFTFCAPTNQHQLQQPRPASAKQTIGGDKANNNDSLDSSMCVAQHPIIGQASSDPKFNTLEKEVIISNGTRKEEVIDQNSIDHAAKTYNDNNNNNNNNNPPPLESPPSFASHTPLPPPLSLAMHHGHLALQQTQLTFNNNNNTTYTHTTSTTGGEDAFNDQDISLDSTAMVRSANALGGGGAGGEVVKRDLRITDSFAAPSITMVSTTTAATIVTKTSPGHGASKSHSSLPHQLPTLSHIGSGFSTGAFNTHIGGNGLHLGGHMGDSGISASSHLEPVRTNGSSFDELNFEANSKWDDGAAQSHGLAPAITGGKSHLGASDGVHHAFVSPMLPPTLLAIAGQFPKQQGAVSKSSPDSTKGSSASRQFRRHNPSSNGGSSTEQNGVVASAQLQPPLTTTDAGVEMNGVVGHQAARMPSHHFFNPKYLQKVERYNEKRTQQRAIGGDGDMSLSDREPPVIDSALGGGERGDDGVDAKIKPPPPITTLWSELTGETDDATTTNTALNCYGPGGSDSSFNFSSVNNVGRLAALSQRGRAVAVENKNNININNNDFYGAALSEAATSPEKGPFDYKVLVKNSVNVDARSANKGVEVPSAASPDGSAKT